MIHVLREQTDEAGQTIKPIGAWFQLAAVATEKAIEEQGQHKADKKVYGHDELRKALERLFIDKCAYCEWQVEEFDVDHFRPCGSVGELGDHPGYYWLTYEWENLYPSCQHCNQRRKDKRRWPDQDELPARGKYDQFPLLDESSRATGPEDCIHEEQRLLLDPCYDDPEKYLAYDPTGTVFSLNDPGGSDPNDVATRSIEVFNLKRRRLKVARHKLIRRILPVIKMIADQIAGANALSDLQGWLEEIQGGGSPHAGLARYIVRHSSEFGA